MRPNRMTSGGAGLNLALWPSTKEPLDLPQGRSRRQVIALAFVRSEEAEPERRVAKLVTGLRQAHRRIAALLSAPLHEERATATPAHSAGHTTTGAYPSHFWTQGLLEYHCLTGDPDALEVAIALGDKTIEFFDSPEQREVLWGFNREIGWSILLLAHLYNITGEQRFRPLLDELVGFVIGYDSAGFRGPVNLSSGDATLSLNHQVLSGLFGYSSMVDGVDLYATITGRTDVSQWLKTFMVDLAHVAIEGAREGSMPGSLFSVVLAVGYERTGDERFMTLTQTWLDNLCRNPPTGGRSGYRGLSRILGHAVRQGIAEPYELSAYPNVDVLEQWMRDASAT